MRENEFIDSLRALFAVADPSVTTGSGPDDCAHVAADGQRLAFSTDAFAEGTHFLPDADPRLVARKALSASLSDLAASACRARWALVSLCLAKGLPEAWAAGFAEGMAETASEYGVAVVGGDTTSSPHGTFVSVTVVGEPLPGGPLLRSGARPGQVLAVTGELGGSIEGRHLEPVARLREMAWLMAFCRELGGEFMPSAAMDISDGLGLDLTRLCRESGVGAVVDAEAVPVSAAAERLARTTGLRPLDHAMADGEDFELLVAMPEAAWARLAAAQQKARRDGSGGGLSPFTMIGRTMAGDGMFVREAGGVLRPLAPEGYEHQW